MFPRRRARPPISRRRVRASLQVGGAFAEFQRCLGRVEEAEAALAAAAPGRRAEGVPLADALATFEEGLRAADEALPRWRTSEVEEGWQLCASGLREASRRAEALRLGQPPDGYEQLYATLGDLMEPLEAFSVALERFQALGA